MPVRTDGVPIPSVLFGYVEIAGAYMPSSRSPFFDAHVGRDRRLLVGRASVCEPRYVNV